MMRSIAKLMLVLGLFSVLSACATKGSCEKAPAPARSEGMMKQYGGK